MKKFLFDPLRANRTAVSREDYLEFFIQTTQLYFNILEMLKGYLLCNLKSSGCATMCQLKTNETFPPIPYFAQYETNIPNKFKEN